MAALTTLAILAIRADSTRFRILVALAGCLAFAAVGEWLQSAVPGRIASLADFRANAVGVLIGIAVWEGPQALGRKRKRS